MIQLLEMMVMLGKLKALLIQLWQVESFMINKLAVGFTKLSIIVSQATKSRVVISFQVLQRSIRNQNSNCLINKTRSRKQEQRSLQMKRKDEFKQLHQQPKRRQGQRTQRVNQLLKKKRRLKKNHRVHHQNESLTSLCPKISLKH